MLVSVFYKYPTNRGTLRSSEVAHRSDGGWRRGQTLTTTTTTIQLEQEKCKDVRRDTLPPRRQGSTTTSIDIIRKEGRDGIGQGSLLCNGVV